MLKNKKLSILVFSTSGHTVRYGVYKLGTAVDDQAVLVETHMLQTCILKIVNIMTLSFTIMRD